MSQSNLKDVPLNPKQQSILNRVNGFMFEIATSKYRDCGKAENKDNM